MTREEVKEILDQQLELLAKASKKEVLSKAKIDYALAIVEIAKARLDLFVLD